MSRWIEVEPLMDKAKEYGGYYEDTVYAVPLADIEEAPSIDLVRCGECKYWSNCNSNYNHRCSRSKNFDVWTRADDFCSYGCRKGDNDE
jgi:hypothetical protein